MRAAASPLAAPFAAQPFLSQASRYLAETLDINLHPTMQPECIQVLLIGCWNTLRPQKVQCGCIVGGGCAWEQQNLDFTLLAAYLGSRILQAHKISEITAKPPYVPQPVLQLHARSCTKICFN
jgi:hypothetical protein